MFNFVYNPIAGKGKAQRFRVSIEEQLKALGLAYTFLETKSRNDAKRLARELTERGETDIVAMGGDGTVNEVLNGLVDPSKVNLGIIPCGSGNDFAAIIDIPSTPDGALEVLLKAAPKPTDYLECSGIRGLNVIGAGIDVEILKRSYRAKVLKGSLNYAVSLLSALINYQSYRFTADYNDQHGDHAGLIICACNGRRIGGGIGICPRAIVDDGHLDVVLVEGLKKTMLPKALVSLVRGKILDEPFATHCLSQELKVVFAEPTTVQVDGELYDDLPFDVRLISNALKIYRY